MARAIVVCLNKKKYYNVSTLDERYINEGRKLQRDYALNLK